ncbi:alpha-mannosidase [Cohnella nanjingensis]|uniref:Glycoside hydrolase family 38 central domain-containing protein n=1 Tax=Cohnella nanjingensis TaxID=1387779 RepID=A0A7X0RRA7_9BACL|nr:glycoside hydrolase family 38 C-terminal domain-containing protein [Cohnella nanjingensis]MBB6672252.1 hypothetical protein [Cohnella nanjingensis]
MNKNQTDKMYVVSHTHWDREWYQDFQAYRTRLVYLIDELIEKMERDPEYRYFMMDGQTIVVEDYLEIRPENRERLLSLIRSGRIAIGPWYVMPDEFLVSGESLIRNFLIGFRQSRSWGVEPLKSGYVPDLFGHNSQLPQILRGFGMDNTVLGRGFLGDADPSEMIWEGADGSRVIGLKLDEDRLYSDFYFFMRWPFADRAYEYNREELILRAKDMLEYKQKRATTDLLLGLDGVDHSEIEPELPAILKTLNEAGLGVTFVHEHFEHYLRDLRERLGDGGTLNVFKGEQRSPGYSGVNNWVPLNVLSSRIHLKQMNANCETLLEKWAEPWGVFTAWEGRPYAKGFYRKAWEYLIQNHPHDSICGCSIDQVHRDMVYRFDQSRLISEQMIKEEFRYISNHLQPDGVKGDYLLTVFNASQTNVDQAIDVELRLPPEYAQATVLPGSGGAPFRIYDQHDREVEYQLLEVKRGVMSHTRPYRDIPDADILDVYRVAFHGNVPSFGYVTYGIRPIVSEGHKPKQYDAPLMAPLYRNPAGSMQVNAHTWDNGRVRIQIHSNGTITVHDLHSGNKYSNVLLFEDEGDVGDGWTHVSPTTNEVYSTAAANAQISVVYGGPLQTCIRIQLNMRVPDRADLEKTRRSETFVELPITTFVELTKDDPIVRFRTVVHNTARDHRLRVLLPSGLAADRYYTSTPFDLVERRIQHPDYRSRLQSDDGGTAPHNGIVAVNDSSCGLAVYSNGLYEAVVRDDEPRTIAMTLYRSTGNEVLTNGGDGGQLLQELQFSYAIRPYSVAADREHTLWRERQLFAAGLRSITRKAGKPLYETPHRAEAKLPAAHSFMAVSGAGLIVSAVKESEDRPGQYVIRIFNVLNRPVQGNLAFDRALQSAQLLNLDEQPAGEIDFGDRQITLDVKPKQVITVEIRIDRI